MRDGFYVVAAEQDVAEGSQLYIELDGEEILLCRHEGELYAIGYYCSHAAFTLEGGSMASGCITCPYHGAEFRLKDGGVEAPPAWEPIKTFPIEIEDGVIGVCATPVGAAQDETPGR